MILPINTTASVNIKIYGTGIILAILLATVWRKILTGENIDEFPAIRQYFLYQNFPFS